MRSSCPDILLSRRKLVRSETAHACPCQLARDGAPAATAARVHASCCGSGTPAVPCYPALTFATRYPATAQHTRQIPTHAHHTYARQCKAARLSRTRACSATAHRSAHKNHHHTPLPIHTFQYILPACLPNRTQSYGQGTAVVNLCPSSHRNRIALALRLIQRARHHLGNSASYCAHRLLSLHRCLLRANLNPVSSVSSTALEPANPP